jgi:hydroxyacylglutathione hydrolase
MSAIVCDVDRIHLFVLGEYQTNCFVVTTPGSKDCWIVDCGFEPNEMLEFIEREGLNPIAILLTHAHSDHIAGIDEAINRFGKLPIYLHEAEAEWCENPLLNLSGMVGMPVRVTAPTNLMKGGETLELNGTEWRVIHTPGHSPGGVCFIHDESQQAIVGDAIFAGSIGRIDFPTSDPGKMRHTIFDVLMKLPDETVIYPGHGPKSTVGRELNREGAEF